MSWGDTYLCEGRSEERAEVVAWLRGKATEEGGDLGERLSSLAQDIEDGDHERTPNPSVLEHECDCEPDGGSTHGRANASSSGPCRIAGSMRSIGGALVLGVAAWSERSRGQGL